MILIKGGKIKPITGAEIENGELLIGDDGKIAAIGKTVDAPADAKVIDATGCLVTPGFIDAHCHIGIDEEGMRWEGNDCNEYSSPVTPEMRSIDGINPRDEAFHLALEGGVTTATTGPGSANVLGGTFVALKLDGNCIDDMIVKYPVAMKIAFGENPKGCYGQNGHKEPVTRMAVAALLREQLFKAKRYAAEIDAAEKDPTKTRPFDMQLEALLPVIRKQIPLKAHAHRADDILTALRIAREQRAVSIRKFFRNKLSVVGMVLVLLMLICAVFAPLITGLLGVDPYTATMQERFQAPSAAHLFGTDNLGRDIFARVLYGAQISMTVGFTVGLLSALIGTALGLYASVNKVLDNVLMRLCDGLKAIPNILLAITLMAVLGANMKNVIISLTIVSIPGVARIARSQALLAREQTYAEAMTAVGASRTRILWRHILPNILSPIIVQMTFTFATAIISEASLSFLGAGIPSPYPSWGGMLNEARGYVYMGWWMIVFPAIFTALSVLGFNLFGDGLRDLIDPLSGR